MYLLVGKMLMPVDDKCMLVVDRLVPVGCMYAIGHQNPSNHKCASSHQCEESCNEKRCPPNAFFEMILAASVDKNLLPVTVKLDNGC